MDRTEKIDPGANKEVDFSRKTLKKLSFGSCETEAGLSASSRQNLGVCTFILKIFFIDDRLEPRTDFEIGSSENVKQTIYAQTLALPQPYL
jgi:hypothetical protein